jgi:1-deoxy-D-xylulose-5-phosphate reductoisomerase
MGPKISVDSATMFNKGLEVIEAHHLFGLAQGNIGLTVQRRSYIHGMVELIDGAILAYAARPDMRLPIQFAMSYPNHWEGSGWGLKLNRHVSIDFEPLNTSHFPSLKVALDAAHRGGLMPTVVSAADSVAVDAFLNGQIAFKDISRVLSVVAARTKRGPVSPSLLELRKADTAARRLAQSVIARKERSD